MHPVSRTGPTPLYRQVRQAVETQLARGSYDFDAPLPSSRALAQELGVSRNTVNQAYQELMAEGFLVSRPRRGLFVNEELRESRSPAGRGGDGAARVSWHERVRRWGDAELPTIQKVPDWDRYPHAFIAGQVDGRTFPAGAWTRALREALDPPHRHYSLRDAVEDDDPLLLDMLRREILPARGIEAAREELLVTMGSQEGLALLSRVLLRDGAVLAVEDPGYLDAMHIFRRAGAVLRPLPVDGSGVVPPPGLAGTSMLYLTPSHQHPTNATLSIGRRHQLLAQAAIDDVVVVEDDYDSELRYQGSPSPALKALDSADRVIYLGTFSKFLAPGLRLGYVVAAPEVVGHLRQERRYSVRHPPGHLQRAMALFIASGRYHRAMRQHRVTLRHKWEAMCESIAREFDWPVPLPPGGVSVWVEGPPALDATLLARRLRSRGVIIERGDILFHDPPAHRNCFRLGFAATRHAAIAPGIRVVGEEIRRQLEAGPAD